MHKIKSVLRLASLGLSQRQIGLSCQIGQATVSDYLSLAHEAGLQWSDVAEWDEDRLVAALLPSSNPAAPWRKTAEPDYAAMRRELQTHKHLTLQLLWQEYREQQPEGYGYSRYCGLYRAWIKRQDVVLRHEHRAGEKLFVDYAGDTIPVSDPATGEIRTAAVFVAVLGASNYTFAEATWTQGLADWIGSHLRAFEFFNAVPEIVVPDNLKSGVTKACRYEPDLNRTYEEMATHYGVAVIPARRMKPRDKAKVENGVLVVERWIMAALRKRKFLSLREVNEAIAELLTRLNTRPFRKMEGTDSARKAMTEWTSRRPGLRVMSLTSIKDINGRRGKAGPAKFSLADCYSYIQKDRWIRTQGAVPFSTLSSFLVDFFMACFCGSRESEVIEMASGRTTQGGGEDDGAATVLARHTLRLTVTSNLTSEEGLFRQG